ncbi:hypothetical protein BJX96DRAFT_118904 [Aspergillus floccosus]
MNDSVIHPASSSRGLPQFDDVLKGLAPYPYTLDIFKSYLSSNHCSEFLEFLMDLGEYSEKYKSAYGEDESPDVQRDGPKHLLGLWQRLVSVYIKPESSRELNLSGEEREELLQYMDGIIPPPPSFIEEVMKRVHESFQSSIFLTFLSSPLPPVNADQASSVSTTVAVSDASTLSSTESLLANLVVDDSLHESKHERVEPSHTPAREMNIHTKTDVLTSTSAPEGSWWKPTIARHLGRIKRRKSDVKMATQRFLHQ